MIPSPCALTGEKTFSFPVVQSDLVTLHLIYCGMTLVTALGGAWGQSENKDELGLTVV